MKIYFAGSIRGGRDDAKIYEDIIDYLSKKGNVLTEHIGNQSINQTGETNITDTIIYKRDMSWLISSDIVVAEVTKPSHGVGYELGIAEKLEKPVLCLFQANQEVRLSAMLKGNNIFTCKDYNNLAEAKLYIDNFLIQSI